jgi:1,2-diacylglycerol 3-alpha-glucosyltransferase
MKILMLCEFYNEQLEYQENLLVKYYVKHGHAVTVVTSTHDSVFDYYADRHDNSRPSRSYEHGGAKIVKLRYRYNILHRLRALERIDALLESEAPDLIFVHDIMLNLPECVNYVRRHPRTRMILDYHADYSNSGKNALSLRVLHGVCRKWFLDRARPHLSRIFPIVPASATFLHEVYGIPMADMELLPLGADSDLAVSVQKSPARQELRASLGIPDDAPVIFTGGKLAPAKRTECLFDALAELPHLPLHVIVAGRAGESDASYEAELRRRAPEQVVHFVGWLSPLEVYRHLAASDLAVFPASQSILWQQAIAMGLPLIVGDTGHQDISYLNQGNIVILARDRIAPAPLAAAIAGVIEHPDRRREMAQAARRVADQHLNWDRLIERTLRFNVRPST